MLAFVAWFGGLVSTQRRQDNELLLYSELGGNFLGKLVVPKRFGALDTLSTLRDLQVQAHKLMKHARRPPSEVVLKVGDKLLSPLGFGYKQDLELAEKQEAVSSLRDALANKKPMFMTYDDNDEYVRRVLARNQLKFSYKEEDDELVLTMQGRDASFPFEASNLCEVFSPRQVLLVVGNVRLDVETDLFFLNNTNVQHLRLANIKPKSWCPLVKLTALDLYVTSIPDGISKLVRLKRLWITGLQGIRRYQYDDGHPLPSLPGDFAFLKLSELHVSHCGAGAVDLLISILSGTDSKTNTIMSSLAKLNVSYTTGTSGKNICIPSVLGTLVGLKQLYLSHNSFIGSIPSELGCLTNLSQLYIHDLDGLDLSLPKQVADLEKLGTMIDVGR
jgi:hypothetical protein